MLRRCRSAWSGKECALLLAVDPVVGERFQGGDGCADCGCGVGELLGDRGKADAESFDVGEGVACSVVSFCLAAVPSFYSVGDEGSDNDTGAGRNGRRGLCEIVDEPHADACTVG